MTGQKEFLPDFYNEEYFQGEGEKSNYENYQKTKGIFQRLVPAICSTFKPRRLLEIGTAYGHFVKHIKQGLSIGIDISYYAIIKRHTTNKVMLASATHLPFKTNTFDVIVSFETLEHLTMEQINQCFREVDRVGTKWFCFTSPHPSGGDDDKDKSHISVLYPKEWRKLGKAMNWEFMHLPISKIKSYPIVRMFDWNVYVFDIANE